MNEKDIQDFKNSILVIKEIRDRTKSISELADKVIRATEDSLYGMQILDEIGNIPMQMQIHFMLLQSFMDQMGKVIGKEE